MIVGNADDRAFGNRWMLRQYGLDVTRIDIEAARDDELTQPVAQEQVSAIIERSEITGVQPSAPNRRGRLVRHVVVAVHHEVAADDDLALLDEDG